MNDLREDINDLIKKIPVLILQFGSDTCGPCHAIRYKLEQWMSEHKEVEARYVDIEKKHGNQFTDGHFLRTDCTGIYGRSTCCTRERLFQSGCTAWRY